MGPRVKTTERRKRLWGPRVKTTERAAAKWSLMNCDENKDDRKVHRHACHDGFSFLHYLFVLQCRYNICIDVAFQAETDKRNN